MLIIGENIHIIAPRVKEAIETRDAGTIQELAVRQVEAGAGILDLNIGPQKKQGHEIMPWIVEAVQEVVDVPLSLDTTNLAAMEAGLKVCKRQAMLNSASADPARLDGVMQLAASHGARVIALTMGVDGIPTTADGRAGIAMEALLPAAEAAGMPVQDVFLDPLVLTVTCNQDVATEAVEAIRMFKMLADPPPTTIVGLSNISNGCPPETRPLINRTMLVMLMGAGLDSAIADPLDAEQNEFIRIVEQRDDSTPLGRLVVALYDATAAMEELDAGLVDDDDPAPGRALQDLPDAAQQGHLRRLVPAHLRVCAGTQGERAPRAERGKSGAAQARRPVRRETAGAEGRRAFGPARPAPEFTPCVAQADAGVGAGVGVVGRRRVAAPRVGLVAAPAAAAIALEHLPGEVRPDADEDEQKKISFFMRVPPPLAVCIIPRAINGFGSPEDRRARGGAAPPGHPVGSRRHVGLYARLRRCRHRRHHRRAVVAGPPVVVVAHVAMDLVPHWDYSVSLAPLRPHRLRGRHRGLAAPWLLFGLPAWMAVMGPVSGFPDWDVLVARLRGKRAASTSRATGGLSSRPPGRVWGIGVQAVIMAASAVVPRPAALLSAGGNGQPAAPAGYSRPGPADQRPARTPGSGGAERKERPCRTTSSSRRSPVSWRSQSAAAPSWPPYRRPWGRRSTRS